MKFEKGQWYTDGERFYCFIEKRPPLHKAYNAWWFHEAGKGKTTITHESHLDCLVVASLTPDFSNAPEFGDCFNVIDGICKYRIDDNGVWIADGRYNLDGRYLNRDTHPTLFNSFAQFMAYWAEEGLKMKEEKDGYK